MISTCVRIIKSISEMMRKRWAIFSYIINVVFLVIGIVSACGGIYLIAGFDQMSATNRPDFDKAKNNIRTMIKDINIYPYIAIKKPPNITNSDPIEDLELAGFVKALGVIPLVYGVVICTIAVLGFVGTYYNSRCLTMMYVVALSILMVTQIIGVVLFSSFQTVLNKGVYLYFHKNLDESYRGFRSNDSVSTAWNLVMQQFNCCGFNGYTDFKTLHSFSETWGEPFHSYIMQNPIDFPLACCNSIEIHGWQIPGPCNATDYINKKGCVDLFWETADVYQPYVVAIVAFICLIQLYQIMSTSYRNVKSKISHNTKTGKGNSELFNNIAPTNHIMELEKKIILFRINKCGIRK